MSAGLFCFPPDVKIGGWTRIAERANLRHAMGGIIFRSLAGRLQQLVMGAAPRLPVTGELARRAAVTRYDELPADVRKLARQCILDWLAVTLAGSREQLSSILLAEANEQGGTPRATLVGHRLRTSAQQAALVNGVAAHALDYDDVNLTMSGHPTAPVLAAVLALGEARDASGAAAIAAFVTGYETACRAGALVAPDHYERGFHATATIGTFGAAAACANLLGLDAEATAIALGIAGTQAAGLKSMFGTMCKPFQVGKAAQNGLIAALLAAHGFTSRGDVLECQQGFAATHSRDFGRTAALTDHHRGWHISDNLFKYHASCFLTHAPIECAQAIRRKHNIDPQSVRKVILRVDGSLAKVCHIEAPKTGLEAKFSLRLTSALALAGLNTASLDTYTDANAIDPVLTALRDKVTVDFQRRWPDTVAEMQVMLVDGSILEARHNSGVTERDLDAQGRRIEAKFIELASPVLGDDGAERVLAMVSIFDRLASIGELTRLCAHH
jgi:2-methylcitrate dehydratase PrpD